MAADYFRASGDREFLQVDPAWRRLPDGPARAALVGLLAYLDAAADFNASEDHYYDSSDAYDYFEVFPNARFGELFEAAINQLIASYDRNPRPMHLLYRYPREHDLVAASGRFQLLQTVTTWRPRPSWSRATAIR